MQTPKSAEQQLLEGIDQLLSQQDETLYLPWSRVNEAVSQVVDRHAKLITKMQGKLLKSLDRHQVSTDNVLDAVQTRVLAGLDAWQHDLHYLLEQLSYKGGFTKAGQPLEAALLEEVTRAPELAYQGTLVLAVKEAIPYLDQLIEVLREIRDRMPSAPFHVKGEPESRADAQDAPDEAPGDVIVPSKGW